MLFSRHVKNRVARALHPATGISPAEYGDPYEGPRDSDPFVTTARVADLWLYLREVEPPRDHDAWHRRTTGRMP